MQQAVATVPEYSATVIAMCSAGLALLALALWGARKEIPAARGLDKIVALWSVCFAPPLAVFGATHLFDPQSLLIRVPSYMPWRPYWVYFVGCALIAAALSLAARVSVRWSGLLFGIMMFLFVAMLHLPGAIALKNNRILWTIVARELSFGGAAWMFAANAANDWSERRRSILRNVGRAFVTLALLVFGLEEILHPAVLPVVPLVQEMPSWVPGRLLIGYLTGAALLVAGASILWGKRVRLISTCLAAWIVLLVLLLYGPIMILALSAAGDVAQVTAIDYFADTLLFAGVVLALAKVAPTTATHSSPASREPLPTETA
ncbi:MAG: hypothetical protein ABI609_16970 [Acidobacteriota bacterium]